MNTGSTVNADTSLWYHFYHKLQTFSHYFALLLCGIEVSGRYRQKSLTMHKKPTNDNIFDILTRHYYTNEVKFFSCAKIRIQLKLWQIQRKYKGFSMQLKRINEQGQAVSWYKNEFGVHCSYNFAVTDTLEKCSNHWKRQS